jgi:hypothetical protein
MVKTEISFCRFSVLSKEKTLRNDVSKEPKLITDELTHWQLDYSFNIIPRRGYLFIACDIYLLSCPVRATQHKLLLRIRVALTGHQWLLLEVL